MITNLKGPKTKTIQFKDWYIQLCRNGLYFTTVSKITTIKRTVRLECNRPGNNQFMIQFTCRFFGCFVLSKNLFILSLPIFIFHFVWHIDSSRTFGTCAESFLFVLNILQYFWSMSRNFVINPWCWIINALGYFLHPFNCCTTLNTLSLLSLDFF